MGYPTFLPGWETVDLIGEGGFSKVYKIKKIDTSGEDFYSALKVIEIPSNSSEYKTYIEEGYDPATITTIFKQQVNNIVSEFKMMAGFKGTANIVSYEDHNIIEKDAGKGYTVLIRMELLSTLTARHNSKPLTEDEIVKVGMDICRALQLCNSKNIVHRDIKPQNIFVNDFGDFKLGDFGIARVMDHATHATKIGTYTYIAPEVFYGKAYDAKTDLYSLGLVLYWLLNERRHPFLPLPPKAPSPSENESAQSRRLNGEQIPPPVNGCEELKAVVLKACAHDPSQRFQNATEFYNALEDVKIALRRKPSPKTAEPSMDSLESTMPLTPPSKGTASKTAEPSMDSLEGTMPLTPPSKSGAFNRHTDAGANKGGAKPSEKSETSVSYDASLSVANTSHESSYTSNAYNVPKNNKTAKILSVISGVFLLLFVAKQYLLRQYFWDLFEFFYYETLWDYAYFPEFDVIQNFINYDLIKNFDFLLISNFLLMIIAGLFVIIYAFNSSKGKASKAFLSFAIIPLAIRSCLIPTGYTEMYASITKIAYFVMCISSQLLALSLLYSLILMIEGVNAKGSLLFAIIMSTIKFSATGAFLLVFELRISSIIHLLLELLLHIFVIATFISLNKGTEKPQLYNKARSIGFVLLSFGSIALINGISVLSEYKFGDFIIIQLALLASSVLLLSLYIFKSCKAPSELVQIREAKLPLIVSFVAMILLQASPLIGYFLLGYNHDSIFGPLTMFEHSDIGGLLLAAFIITLVAMLFAMIFKSININSNTMLNIATWGLIAESVLASVYTIIGRGYICMTFLSIAVTILTVVALWAVRVANKHQKSIDKTV